MKTGEPRAEIKQNEAISLPEQVWEWPQNIRAALTAIVTQEVAESSRD